MKRRSVWPWALGLGLGVGICFNLALLFFALSTPSTPMEPGSPYSAGQEYGREMERLRAWQQSGVAVQWSWPNAQKDANVVGVQFVAPNSRTAADFAQWKVRYRALRADRPASDMQGELRRDPKSPGRFLSAPISTPPGPGIWFVRLEIDNGQNEMVWKDTLQF